MLVSKEPNFEGKIVAIKLVSGEEIIAKCILDERDGKSRQLRIKQPLNLVIGQSRQSNGQSLVSFAPWMLSLQSTEVITLKTDHVVFIAEAADNPTRQYLVAVEPK